MSSLFPQLTHSRFSSKSSSDALLIFCRAPRLGAVKTRLAATLGAPIALQIYRAMLRDCLDLGRQLAPAVTTIACYTPGDAFDEDSELSAIWDGAHLPQRGADLGARMLQALADARAQGFRRAVIIGSDAPDLHLDYLEGAFRKLRDHEVFVVPSVDGGFVLIGASCALPDAIFDGITWSRDDVWARLSANIKALELNGSSWASWQDVDEVADLRALRERLQTADASVARATREVLERLDLPST